MGENGVKMGLEWGENGVGMKEESSLERGVVVGVGVRKQPERSLGLSHTRLWGSRGYLGWGRVASQTKITTSVSAWCTT